MSECPSLFCVSFLYRGWPTKQKRLLIVALKKETAKFGSYLIRQGAPTENMFFIMGYVNSKFVALFQETRIVLFRHFVGSTNAKSLKDDSNHTKYLKLSKIDLRGVRNKAMNSFTVKTNPVTRSVYECCFVLLRVRNTTKPTHKCPHTSTPIMTDRQTLSRHYTIAYIVIHIDLQSNAHISDHSST